MASSSTTSPPNLWDEILNSVSGRTSSSVSKKNLIVLGEPQTGKSTLLSHILKGSRSSLVEPIALPSTVKQAGSDSNPPRLDLATGYEWVDVRDEGDEETLPPLSIYTPPSSHPSLLQLLPLSLSQPPPPPTTASTSSPSSSPSSVLADTSILIVLDWTKPATMIVQLLGWLEWVEEWSKRVSREVEGEEGRERLQYHLQHYNEPPPPAVMSSPSLGGNSSPTKQLVPLPSTPSPATASATYNPNSNEVLPLGPGTLTRNPYGVPITIVCTKADQIDLVAEELGFGGPAAGGGSKGAGGGGGGKGGGWEERTDWIGQVLRLVGLMHGASLFYTSLANPSTFSLLRTYLLHRIFSPPPPPILSSSNNPSSPTTSTSLAPIPSISSSSTRFPFPHRANVLDRDQVLVPSGWDSWGKIMVLREGFEPERVTSAWEVSVRRWRVEKGGGQEGEGVVDDEEEEDVEDLWAGVVPEMGEDVLQDPSARMITTLLDQTFLAKEYAAIQNDPKRDPRQSFRNPASTSTSTSSSTGGGELERLVGVVGPMGSGGLSMPGVEKAMAEMEGLSSKSSRDPTTRPSLSSSSRDYSYSSPTLPSPLTSPSLSGSAAFPSSAAPSGSAAAGVAPGGAGQPPPSTEALHNFFQSLLTARKNTTGGVAGLPGATSASAGPASPGAGGRVP
ncbi:hypothetical protein BDY24DRAFT_170473 [Mrakia frigida]|uniref:uncharacterized protein n=1 Tax=Mrakia frigida TaxID=29902 RepID=UPI003FCC19BB